MGQIHFIAIRYPLAACKPRTFTTGQLLAARSRQLGLHVDDPLAYCLQSACSLLAAGAEEEESSDRRCQCGVQPGGVL
jgi:hypothetical protein